MNIRHSHIGPLAINMNPLWIPRFGRCSCGYLILITITSRAHVKKPRLWKFNMNPWPLQQLYTVYTPMGTQYVHVVFTCSCLEDVLWSSWPKNNAFRPIATWHGGVTKTTKNRCLFSLTTLFPSLEVEKQWLCHKLDTHFPGPQFFHLPFSGSMGRLYSCLHWSLKNQPFMCAMVKGRYIGGGHPTFNRNPYNGAL